MMKIKTALATPAPFVFFDKADADLLTVLP